MSKTTADLLWQLAEVKQEMKITIEEKGPDISGGLVVYPEAINEINNQIDNLELEISDLKVEIVDLESEVNNKESQINSLIEDKDALNQQVTNKNQQIRTLENEIGVLNSTIDLLNDDINDKRSQINDLNNDIEQLESEIFNKDSEISNLRDDIAALNDQIAQLQARIEELENGSGGEGKIVNKITIPNGFRFVDTWFKDIDWGKYDWSAVYDISYPYFHDLKYTDYATDDWPIIDNWTSFSENFNAAPVWGYKAFDFRDTSDITKTTVFKIPKCDYSHLIDGRYMFCSAGVVSDGYNIYATYPIGDFKYNMDKLIDGKLMFANSSLENFESSIPKCKDASYMFGDCTSLTSVYIENASNVILMDGMFDGCTSLTSILLMDTSGLRTTYSMFRGCTSLTSIPQLDTSNVNVMSSMFAGCTSLTSIPQLDTSNVGDMDNMFAGCTSLTSIPMLNCPWVGISRGPFGYSNLNNLTDIGGFKDLKVGFTINFLDKCPNATIESLMNVINNLYDLTANGMSGQSISFGSTNLAKLTSEQIAIAINKGWTLI